MRNTKLMTLLAAGLVLFACQKERTENDILFPGNLLTFTATIDGAGTRTSIDGTKISWNPAEEINIFFGASEGSKFVSQNTEPSQSVTFSGTLTAFTGTTEAGEPNSFWAIYPYDETNSSSGSSVTAYLPENQVGVPNNVPDKALMMVAKASGLALSFKQVCARIKVNVTIPGIRKIEIRGNNDETIAGSAVITMNSQGLPEWQDAGTGAGKVIELVPESGTTFEVAEYSIPIYPQTFSAGFTMTCYKDGEMGSYSTGAVTFGRNQVRSVNTNKVTEWESLTFEYVDLGLSVKWATFNLGATKPEEYGDHYAWGETETKKYYSESDYKWFNYVEGSYSLTKYNSNSSFGVVDNKTVLEESDDVAHVKLGGNWRMATDTEWTELLESCTWTWTTLNGISGRLVTSNIEGYTDRSIFLPAAGVWFSVYEQVIEGIGARGDYWSSSPCTDATDDPFCAWGVGINPTSIGFGREDVGRCFGLSIRPVYDDSETVHVESITLDQNTLELYVGQTATLRATVLPANATNQTVVWRSVDTSIATVDQNGIITGVAEGSTVVIATNYNGMKQAECMVTVHSGSSALPIPEAIDLGLPSGLKWASFNLGATVPEEYGDYYAWGETEPYYSGQDPLIWKEGKDAGYDWPSYKWCNGSSSSFTKYCSDSSYGYNGYTDDKTILDPEDDAAHVNLGGNWRMPTDAEWTELIDNCTWTWTTRNGVNGYQVSSSNGSSIFLPATGYRNNDDLDFTDVDGSYWSSSLDTESPNRACYLGFHLDYFTRSINGRIDGYSIRPVYAE